MFTTPDTNVATTATNRVLFFLDDPLRNGPPIHTEGTAPFDFVGGSAATANNFDSTVLTNGFHSITAQLPLVDGTTEVVTASFTAGAGIVNQPPALSLIGNQSVVEGASATVGVSATDPDADLIILAASGLPVFATFTDNGGGSGSLDLDPILGDFGVFLTTITASDGTNIDTETFTITVSAADSPPIITQHPLDRTVALGQTATFMVMTSGTEPLSFQWQENGVDVGGAVSSSFTIPEITLADNGSLFRVGVTNSNGTVTSNSATLTVVDSVSGALVIDSANPRWFRYQDGGPFFMCGPGDPENFLYRGTRNPDGTRTGDQMSLINKLAPTGANSIYFQMIRSHGGDGNATHNPFIDSNPAQGLDEDILNQWEMWFTAMDDAGIVNYAFFFDDSASVWGPGDTVPAEEQAFLEAIVARFKHHKLLVWVIAEEYQEKFSVARISNMAAIVRGADDNSHPIAVHKLNGLNFTEFADDPNLDQFAIQFNNRSALALHDGMVSAFSDAARRYNINMSESSLHGNGILARQKNWAIAMGGAYVMVFQWFIDTTAVQDLEGCGRLVQFMEATNFNEMIPRDDLAFGATEYVLAKPSDSFILYASALNGELGVRGIAPGTYDFHWLDIPSGTVVDQSSITVGGGNVTWTNPSAIGPEVALWIRPNNNPPPTPTIDSFIATPTSITAGESATLNWATTNADGVSVNGGATLSANGSGTVTPTTTTTYTLAATGLGGTATSTVTVTVNPAPPTVDSFSVVPSTITVGESATLSWATTNVDSVSINGGMTLPADGSSTVSPTTTTTYTLTATGPGGTITSTVTVTVNPAPPAIDSFSAIPSTITVGGSATLSWATTNADSVSINGGATLPVDGSSTVNPTMTTIYTLTATGPGGTATSNSTVTVDIPSVTMIGPVSANRGDQVLFTVTLTNTSSSSTLSSVELSFNIIPDRRIRNISPGSPVVVGNVPPGSSVSQTWSGDADKEGSATVTAEAFSGGTSIGTATQSLTVVK